MIQIHQDTGGENFHADHHLYHTKNYGIYNCLMDMYFGTATENEEYMIRPSLYSDREEDIVYTVKKEVEGAEAIFHFALKC